MKRLALEARFRELREKTGVLNWDGRGGRAITKSYWLQAELFAKILLRNWYTMPGVIDAEGAGVIYRWPRLELRMRAHTQTHIRTFDAAVLTDKRIALNLDEKEALRLVREL